MLKIAIIDTDTDKHNLAHQIDMLQGVVDTTVYDGLGDLLLDLHDGLFPELLAGAEDELAAVAAPVVDNLRCALQELRS